MRSQADTGTTGLFRRRRFVVAHRRRRFLLRLVRPFATAAVLVVLPAVSVLWVATSPQFVVDDLEVGSTTRISPRWAKDQVATLRGHHLLTLKVSDVEQRLGVHPWFMGVRLAKRIPGRLEIEIEERRPAALWNDSGRLTFLDRHGVPIAALTAEHGGVDLVVVRAVQPDPDTAARAITLAADWASWRPGDRLSEVELLGSDDFRVIADSLPFAVRLRPSSIKNALASLERALPILTGRYQGVTAVDLRFSRQIVFQPAAEPPIREG